MFRKWGATTPAVLFALYAVAQSAHTGIAVKDGGSVLAAFGKWHFALNEAYENEFAQEALPSQYEWSGVCEHCKCRTLISLPGDGFEMCGDCSEEGSTPCLTSQFVIPKYMAQGTFHILNGAMSQGATSSDEDVRVWGAPQARMQRKVYEQCFARGGRTPNTEPRVARFAGLVTVRVLRGAAESLIPFANAEQLNVGAEFRAATPLPRVSAAVTRVTKAGFKPVLFIFGFAPVEVSEAAVMAASRERTLEAAARAAGHDIARRMVRAVRFSCPGAAGKKSIFSLGGRGAKKCDLRSLAVSFDLVCAPPGVERPAALLGRSLGHAALQRLEAAEAAKKVGIFARVYPRTFAETYRAAAMREITARDTGREISDACFWDVAAHFAQSVSRSSAGVLRNSMAVNVAFDPAVATHVGAFLRALDRPRPGVALPPPVADRPTLLRVAADFRAGGRFGDLDQLARLLARAQQRAVSG